MTVTVEPQFPTEKDMLAAVLDALISLSNRLFPDEEMVVQARSTEVGSDRSVTVVGGAMTYWVKASDARGMQPQPATS